MPAQGTDPVLPSGLGVSKTPGRAGGRGAPEHAGLSRGPRPPGTLRGTRARASPCPPRRGRRRPAGSPRQRPPPPFRGGSTRPPRPGRPPVPGVDPAGPPGVVVNVEDLAVVIPGLLPAPG
jgi:hypothetical protein